jgi:DNA-binding FrmR family transcriptional regulator
MYKTIQQHANPSRREQMIEFRRAHLAHGQDEHVKRSAEEGRPLELEKLLNMGAIKTIPRAVLEDHLRDTIHDDVKTVLRDAIAHPDKFGKPSL